MGARELPLCATHGIPQALLLLICLVKISRYPAFHVSRKYLRPDGLLLKEYIGICIPMMAQSIVIAVGGTLVQSHINQYGTVFAAGISAAGKIFSVVETGAIALAFLQAPPLSAKMWEQGSLSGYVPW
ncbi:MAG: hypothetical protein ACLTBV_00290 [Enterocloster bolteae]